jgi:outer membrane protein assembly factor BamB
VGDDRGVLRALDALSGKAKWEAYTAGAIYLSPAVWEGRVYVGSADGRVYAYDVRRGANATELTLLRPLKTGEAVPAKPTAADVLWTARGRKFNSFIVGPTALLAAGNDSTKCPIEHFVVAMELADGSDLWYEKLPAPAVKGGTAVDYAGRTFVALNDGRVVCLGALR